MIAGNINIETLELELDGREYKQADSREYKQVDSREYKHVKVTTFLEQGYVLKKGFLQKQLFFLKILNPHTKWTLRIFSMLYFDF